MWENHFVLTHPWIGCHKGSGTNQLHTGNFQHSSQPCLGERHAGSPNQSAVHGLPFHHRLMWTRCSGPTGASRTPRRGSRPGPCRPRPHVTPDVARPEPAGTGPDVEELAGLRGPSFWGSLSEPDSARDAPVWGDGSTARRRFTRSARE
jgi:hypothetical protein